MAFKFSSSTKSWGTCDADQRRVCIAHATFNKLHGFPGDIKTSIHGIKAKLLLKIKLFKERKDLNPEETALLLLENKINELTPDITGIEKLERIFPAIEKFVELNGTGGLDTKEIKTFIKNKELSKILRAMANFKWTGSSLSAPSGKSASDIGISDELLEKLMNLTDAGSLLSSWLQTGDEKWKRFADSEIDKRKQELDYLKRNHPKDPKILLLGSEIAKLESDWML